MTAWQEERLGGCSAITLDGYLRGVGFLLLADRAGVGVRGSWGDDGVLVVHTPGGLSLAASELVRAITDPEGSGVAPVRTPWRGGAASGSFAALRNEADDGELGWFDACGLPREPSERSEQSDKTSNPLLFQGGQFRIDIAAAHADAIDRLRKSTSAGTLALEVLLALLQGRALPPKSERLTTTKKALGAFQSGRATGPGHSVNDVEPTDQKASTSAWDVVLLVEALSAFRGTPTRRPSGGAARSSFPLVVRSRAASVGENRPADLREDPEGAFELVAPLWRAPTSGRVLRRAIACTRLRSEGRAVEDTIGAALLQASRGSLALGFDRLVRYSFIAAGPKAMPYALRRGVLHSRGSRAAELALREIVPFLRRIDREVGRKSRTDADAPASYRLVRRRLGNAMVALAAEPGSQASDSGQQVLTALASFARVAARAAEEAEAPRLSSAWRTVADDRTPEFRLARALAGSFSDGGSGWLRGRLTAEALVDGRWVIDSTTGTIDPARSSSPLHALAVAAVRCLRTRRRSLAPTGIGVSLEDVMWLVPEVMSAEQGTRLVTLTAALAAVDPPPARRPGLAQQQQRAASAAAAGVGDDLARLLLSCAPTAAGTPDGEGSLERSAQLASLVLAGNIDLARIAADRELRRRGLHLAPPPLRRPEPADRASLALALMLPLDPAAEAALLAALQLRPTRTKEVPHDRC